jgi:hypothetical protein
LVRHALSGKLVSTGLRATGRARGSGGVVARYSEKTSVVIGDKAYVTREESERQLKVAFKD